MTKSKLVLIILLGGLTMGTGNLPDLASSPTKVDATTEQYNKITDALQGHQVMRDSNGEPVDGTYDIGRPSSGRVRKLYATSGINVNGQDIDLSSIALQNTGVNSGASKTSGYPQYLEAGGSTGGDNVFTILGATTPLEMTIDGEGYTLETDLISDDLSLAPSSNNTCLVDDSKITSDPHFSKDIGEHGYYLNVDTIGSEISSLDGTTQVFSITNGSATEYFIAEVDTTNDKITPILRGIGGTDRIAFSDNDTITLLKAHYIFLDNDLATIDTTTTHPTWGATEPASPSTGDYWFDSTVKTWKRYSGASWEQLGRIYLGYAICDDSDCVAVEHVDFNLGWSSLLTYRGLYKTGDSDSTTVKIKGQLKASVSGELVVIGDKELDIDDDFISGESAIDDTWCYVYMDKFGVLYLSHTTPRPKGERDGFYHPSEYYRCVSVFFVYYGSTASTRTAQAIFEKDKNLYFGVITLISIAVSSFPTDYYYFAPPIATGIDIYYDVDITGAATAFYLSFNSLESLYNVFPFRANGSIKDFSDGFSQTAKINNPSLGVFYLNESGLDSVEGLRVSGVNLFL